MAKISLRMYNREIEGLVEQGQRLDEAIAHCRHILQTFPKHLETYRLLGKAYLEAKRYEQAVDIFQRVLVAAPEDFVAHVGMSIIADDKGKLDDAIWHMERAFEVQPSNAAIQGELQRLFGRRDGVEPPKIRLTRGALAHMYVQGELYNQAISEIRAVLSSDAKRADMQTLLARAYYRNGQKAEAADICGELLGNYPYCLDANRIMSEIAPNTGRPDAAQEYRQRVVELDPYAEFATESIFQADNVSDNLVTLERLEYTGEPAQVPPALGIGLATDATAMSRPVEPAPTIPPAVAADLPAWLRTEAEEPASTAPARPVSEPDKNDIPEFLRQAGWGASSGETTEQPSAPFEAQPAELGGEGAVEGELPEWVKALAPTEEDTTPSQPVPPSAPMDTFQSTTGAFGQSLGADTPDWLSELGEPETRQSEVLRPDSPLPANAPDWLSELGEPEAKQPEIEKTESPLPASETASLPADAPDWLRDLGPATTASAAPAAQAADDTPDWLKDLGARELDEPAVPARQESEASWLDSLRAEEQAPAAPSEIQRDETPDWLRDFSNDLETPITKTPTPEPLAAEPAKPEVPPSLGSLGTTAQEQDDAMAWLESLAAKHGAKAEELVTDPNARTDVAPEWVDKAKEIGEQQAAAPAQPQPAQPAPATPAEDDQTGTWLPDLAAQVEEAPAPEAAPQEPEKSPFDFRSTFADQSGFVATEAEAAKEEPPVLAESETPAWLSDLPETPTVSHGLEDAPSWLRGLDELEQQATPAQAEVPAAEEPGSDLPAWLADLEKEEVGSVPPMLQKMPSDELPAWLQSEEEPEPEVKEPANPADWRPVAPPEPAPAEPTPASAEVQTQPVQYEPPVAETQAPPAEEKPAFVEAQAQPAEEQPLVVEKQPEPAQPAPPPAPVHEEKKPEPVVTPAPQRVEKAPEPIPAPAPVRPKPAVSAAPKPALATLGDAQAQLGRGNIAAALDIYTKLIRKGKSLEDIIRDLRDALYRYPVEVPLWQSLGDAYMRANRLQEALDAYTKAEELLR